MGCVTSVEEQNIGVVESCGKYSRLARSGCVCLNPLACEKIAGKVTLRVQQLDVTVETKTKDNVFVHIVVAIQYLILTDAVFQAFYRLSNPREQITAYVFDVVRAEVPKIGLDDVFITKDHIADAIKDELTKVMEEFGFEILKTLIVDINPDTKVKHAMNDINAAARMKVAAANYAEAEKIKMIKSAEADAESKYLQGVGVARQRMAIVDGLRDSVVHFSEAIEGSSAKDVMDLVLITQYFDTMKEIGHTSKDSTVFVQHSPQAVAGIARQVREGFLTGNGQNAPLKMKQSERNKLKELEGNEETLVKKPKKGKGKEKNDS